MNLPITHAYSPSLLWNIPHSKICGMLSPTPQMKSTCPVTRSHIKQLSTFSTKISKAFVKCFQWVLQLTLQSFANNTLSIEWGCSRVCQSDMQCLAGVKCRCVLPDYCLVDWRMVTACVDPSNWASGVGVCLRQALYKVTKRAGVSHKVWNNIVIRSAM